MAYRVQDFNDIPLKHTFMFGQVMQKPEICQLFLEELFDWDIERIECVDREKDITDRYLGHGVRLDIYLRHSNQVYNIEMQSEVDSALERRIRFYQSGIDREELRRGVPYEELPETFIIFICDYDPIGAGRAVYTRQNFWINDEYPCDDGTHAILLNSQYKDRNASPAMLEFLDYIRTNDDTAEYSSSLAQKAKKQVERVRQDREMRERYMVFELELQKKERKGKEIGRLEGDMLRLIRMVCKKLAKGKSVEIIANELEEEIAVIEPICRIAEQFSPEYDEESIYEALRKE